MTLSNGNIFRVNDPLGGESTGVWLISLKKISNAELWCFLWSTPEQSGANNWDAGDLGRHCSLWYRCNEKLAFVVIISSTSYAHNWNCSCQYRMYTRCRFMMTRRVCDAYYVIFMIPYTRIIFQNFRIQNSYQSKMHLNHRQCPLTLQLAYTSYALPVILCLISVTV